MPLSPSQRMQRYREKMKQQGLYSEALRKDRLRHQMKRSNLSPNARVIARRREVARKKNKVKKESTRLQGSLFASKQAKGKAMKRAMNALPTNLEKKIEIVTYLSRELGVLSSERQPRVALQLVCHSDLTWVKSYRQFLILPIVVFANWRTQ
jgi:hypothetical protein